MKKILLAATAFGLAASSALAADLPRRSAPSAPYVKPSSMPVFAWQGFYAGVHAGYGFGQFTGPAAVGLQDPNGFVGGAQIGYNHQINQYVIGLETDLSASTIGGKASAAGVAGSKYNQSYLGTVRGRAGIAVDRFLPYLTAGYAYSGGNVTIPGTGKSSPFQQGWVAGVGVEYAITSNLSARVEGLYVDLMDRRVLGSKIGTEAGIVRAGVNARF
jgi:outer membrane immunogenic protein